MSKKKEVEVMEFSKKLLVLGFVLALSVMIFSMALMWNVGDTSPLSYLIPSAFGLLATGYGFYYKKAERENLVKIKNQHGFIPDVKDEEEY